MGDETTTEATESKNSTGLDQALAALPAEPPFGMDATIWADPKVKKLFLQDNSQDKRVFKMAFAPDGLPDFQNTLTNSYVMGGNSGGNANPFKAYMDDYNAFSAMREFDKMLGPALDFGARNSPFADKISEMNESAMAKFNASHMNVMSLMLQQQMLVNQVRAQSYTPPVGGPSRLPF